MKSYIMALALLASTLAGNAQSFPAKEKNCFENFNENATTRSDVNAYLLGYITRLVYAQYLNKDNGYNLRLTDTSRFRDKFIERTKHFFPAASLKLERAIPNTQAEINKNVGIANIPQKDLANIKKIGDADISGVTYKWIWRSDGQGKNPEAMLVSTQKFMLVIFRGTDRVEGANPFNYDWGEWIYTDFDALDPQPPCSGCPGKVHRGFRNSLEYAGFQTELINEIKNRGGAEKKIWITGHSLGGALAQLFAFNLHKAGVTPHGVYVYNSPHPGDVNFVRELERAMPGQRIQRFEYISDPIHSGPPQTLNWMPGGTAWGRAGIRNHFTKERSDGYNYNTAEQNGIQDLALLAAPAGALNLGGMCFHHPTWLVRACYNLLPNSMQAKVPDPPAQVQDADEGCNHFDINQGTSGSLIDAGTALVAAGTYKLRNVATGRYLMAVNNCSPINGCCDLEQRSSSSGDAFKWKIAKVPNALFESYTITSELNNKVLDGDMPCVNDNGCKVHICNRHSSLVPLRTNQEWKFEKISGNKYRMSLVAGGKKMRVAPGCASQDGCRFELHTSSSGNYDQWEFIKQ